MSDTERAGSADAAQKVVRYFASDLARLRELHGNPSFARMHSAIRHSAQAAGSKNTFHRMISNPDRIYEPEFVRGFVLALGLDDGQADAWEQRRIQALQQYQLLRDGAAAPDGSDELPIKQWRAHRKLAFAAAAFMVALATVLTVVAFVSGNKPTAYRARAAAAASPGPPADGVVTSPRDGADPKDSGCALDPALVTLDSAEVDYHGLPAGLDELRYSPRCGVAWARFEPFPKAQIPAGAIIHVDVVRPDSHNLRLPFQAPYVGAPVYGNVMQSTEHCVYAAVTIGVAGKELPESHTHCFRGKTPLENVGLTHQ